jgi:hypothetical protein
VGVYGGWRYRKLTVMKIRMRYAADMPDLDKYVPAFVMYRLCNELPTLDLGRAVNARRVDVTGTLSGDL